VALAVKMPRQNLADLSAATRNYDVEVFAIREKQATGRLGGIVVEHVQLSRTRYAMSKVRPAARIYLSGTGFAA